MYAYDKNDGLHSAIHRAFRITTGEPIELSYSNRDDLTMTHLSAMQLLQPEPPACTRAYG